MIKTSAFKLLRWPVYIINSVDNTKLPCYTLPLMQHHSFLRNLPPYSFNYQLSYSELISIECHKTNTRVITTANHRKVKRLQEDEVKISKQFEGQENASDPKVWLKDDTGYGYAILSIGMCFMFVHHCDKNITSFQVFSQLKAHVISKSWALVQKKTCDSHVDSQWLSEVFIEGTTSRKPWTLKSPWRRELSYSLW